MRSHTDLVDVEEDEDMVRVILNRPAKRNALNQEMVVELRNIFEAARDGPSRSVLISGRGNTTSAGADLDIVGADDFETSDSDYERAQREMIAQINRHPDPVVMACKGAVIGAAFIMALESDFAILGEETKFAYPEVNLGLFSNRGPKLMEHLVGAQAAKEIVLIGDPIPPERAHEMGLAFDVVPDDAVDDQSEALARELAQHDPRVVELVKDTFRFEEDGFDHVEYP